MLCKVYLYAEREKPYGDVARICICRTSISASNQNEAEPVRTDGLALWTPGIYLRGISSHGRALASHARGTGIDTLILQPFASALTYALQSRRRMRTYPDTSFLCPPRPLEGAHGLAGGCVIPAQPLALVYTKTLRVPLDRTD